MAVKDKITKPTVTEYRPLKRVWENKRISQREVERLKKQRALALAEYLDWKVSVEAMESEQPIRLWPAIAISLSLWMILVFVFWWAFL